MRAIARWSAAALVALALAWAQSPVTITPTLVSVQLGQPLYCAARWTKAAGTVQLYCYTSTAGHTWDSLIFNALFPVNTTVTLPYVLPCPTVTACNFNLGILWIFRKDPVNPAVVDWQVSWAGTGTASGTFQ